MFIIFLLSPSRCAAPTRRRFDPMGVISKQGVDRKKAHPHQGLRL